MSRRTSALIFKNLNSSLSLLSRLFENLFLTLPQSFLCSSLTILLVCAGIAPPLRPSALGGAEEPGPFAKGRNLFGAPALGGRVKPVQALHGRRTSSRDRGSDKPRRKCRISRPRGEAPFLFPSGGNAPSQASPPTPNRLRKNSSCTSDFIFSFPGTSSRTHYRGFLPPSFREPFILTGENSGIY